VVDGVVALEFDGSALTHTHAGTTTTLTLTDVFTPKAADVDVSDQTRDESGSLVDSLDNPTLTIDTTAVTLSEAGETVVTYTATDGAGNVHQETLKVRVTGAQIHIQLAAGVPGAATFKTDASGAYPEAYVPKDGDVLVTGGLPDLDDLVVSVIGTPMGDVAPIQFEIDSSNRLLINGQAQAASDAANGHGGMQNRWMQPIAALDAVRDTRLLGDCATVELHTYESTDNHEVGFGALASPTR
jgi:hypothetical protein